MRISIIKSLPNDTINSGMQFIAHRLEATFREQSLNRRPDLESGKNGESPLSSIITLNINGIKSKYNELLMLLQQRKPDIICLQETKKLVTDKRIHINGYQIHDVPAQGTGLGLAIGFRKNSGLQCNVIESSEDVILASINGNNTNTIVGNVYRSPNPEKMKVTTLKVVDVFNRYLNKINCLLAGDWNEVPKVLIKKLLKKGVQTYATCAPTKGTRVYPNRKRTKRPIDYGLTSNDQLIASQCTRFNWMISDHLPVEVKINLSHSEIPVETVTVFDRNKLYEPRIAEAIKNHEIDLTGLDPISGIKLFHEELDKTLRRLKVIREIKPQDGKIIIPKIIKRAIAQKRLVDKAVKKGQKDISELIDARKSVKKAISDSKRKSYMGFIKKGIDYLKNNDSKNSWKWLKTHSGRTRNKMSADLVYKPETRVPETDPSERLKIWADHFRKLSIAGPIGAAQEEIVNSDRDIGVITDCPITWLEVSEVLKAMRKGKAAGNDMIPGEVYKLVENETEPISQMSKSMLTLLNNIYNGNEFPIEWRDCTVVPIFKKGDHLDPNNYRGIALINTLLKVITKVLASRLQTVCTSFNLLKREQVGFIKNEEGVSQAACLLESCQRRKIRDQNTILCFLDLRKAYDMVPHERLLYKLKRFGLGDKMINFIKRMYENTFMRVRVNNQLTESFRYERGVRQGCPTSPLLFNIYINDILDEIIPLRVEGIEQGLRGLMFADDTVIMAENHTDLSVKLESINRWMNDNAMEVNPSKCGIMEIQLSPDQVPIEPLLFNGEEIPKVDKYVYLGIEFNNLLNIEMMSKFRLGKGKDALFALMATLRNNKVPLEYRVMLIKSILIPTLHYGSEIFGMNEQRVNALKRILDNGIKCIVKKSNFCRLRAYEEFDIKPIYVSAAVSRARGLKKWTGSNGLISDCIRSQVNFKSKQSTWIKESKRWLKLMRIDLELPSREMIRQVVSNRTTKMHEKDKSVIGQWAQRYQLTSGKAIRKSEIKCASSYTGINAITKIRTGTFTYTKQLVRLQVIPSTYTNRCVCCDTEELEDAEHLLFRCNKFNDMREECNPGLNEKLQSITTVEAQNILIKKLLGEEGLTSGRKIPKEVLKTIKYLSWILPKRSALIAERKGDNGRGLPPQ
jgi:endonuclease/exonuclease/phosphatase (EEP) superfamily protein YafD